MKLRKLVPLLALAGLAADAEARVLKVVATTEDLASITRELGGDRVQVDALAKGYQDPHFVEAKPSFVLKLHGADLVVAVGRELEMGWLPPLITQSRNPRIQPGARGYLDASQNVKILDIPAGQITRAMGDVHPLGNPHYWLDPTNGRRMAQAIAKRLSELSPDEAAVFTARQEAFDGKVAAAEKRWDEMMAPHRGVKVVTYHRSWSNFADRFGLDVIGFAEPRPGIPPSPSHTIALIREMKERGVKLLLVEPYFDLKTPNSIARETGARVVVLPPSVGGEKVITDYVSLFDYDLKLLVEAIKATGAK